MDKKKRTRLMGQAVTRGVPSPRPSAKMGEEVMPSPRPSAILGEGVMPSPRPSPWKGEGEALEGKGVEIKDSGVEWLGDVPLYWTISKIKYVAFINMGQSPNSEEYNQNGDGIPFLQGNAEFGKTNPIPKNYCNHVKKIAFPGDYLLSVRAPVGALNIADQTYGIGRGLCAIRPFSETLDHDYTWYLLNFFRKQLDMVSTGSTYEAVSVSQVGDSICVIPPLPEQHSIVDFLDRETARIDTIKEKVKDAIEKLQEYRTALISAAVTGKIAVPSGKTST